MSSWKRTHHSFTSTKEIPWIGKVLCITGWSGSGKTTLICALIPMLAAHGLTVSTLKYTHHNIDPDPPGKDSRRHRDAGAKEVMLVGPKRTVIVSEECVNKSSPLSTLLTRLQPVDLVLVESFNVKNFKKIEVWRAAIGKPHAVQDSSLLAVAMSLCDITVERDAAIVPILDLNDIKVIATFIINQLGILRSMVTKV